MKTKATLFDERDFEYTSRAVMDDGSRKKGWLRLESLGHTFLHFTTEDGAGHSFALGSLMRGGACDGWLRRRRRQPRRNKKGAK